MKRHNIFFISIILIATIIVFTLQFHFDNKYTYDSPIGEQGIIDLTGDSSPNMLTYGWKVYQQKIVAPENIEKTQHDDIIYIGQYNDLSFQNGSFPHGVATYHLKVLLPTTLRHYAMEIPEIYSASRIYIDNQLMWNRGHIDNYQPHVQSGVIMFDASDSIDITIQVRDESHYYSGLVYPFLLGHRDDVMNILNIRQLIRYFVCAFMLMASLLIGIMTCIYRKKEFFYLFAFSLTTSFYLAYPFYHQFGLPMFIYRFEDCCYFMMIALMIQLHCHILHLTPTTKHILATISCLFIIGSLCLPLFFYQNQLLMSTYSFAINAYKCILFSWMMTSAFFLFQANDQKTKIWLINISIFSCALFMNAFFPLFEPVYGLWQIELAAILIAFSLSFVFIQETIHQYYQNIILVNHIHDMKKQFQILDNHYQQNQKTFAEIHQMKHDMRHHVLVLQNYNQNHDYQSLATYLQGLSQKITNDTYTQICDHTVFNAVLHHYLQIAQKQHIDIDYHIHVPQHLHIEDWKLGSLLGNLFENAIEGCQNLPQDQKIIHFQAYMKNHHLIVIINNPLLIPLQSHHHAYLSTKHSGHGLGIPSMKNIVHSLGGEIMIQDTPPLFEIKIVIYQKRKEEA